MDVMYLITTLLLVSQGGLVFSEVKPAAVFSDRMILQRDKPVSVWGTADAGEKVTVSFGGQNKEVAASTDGRWLVQLDPMSASAEPRVMMVGGAGEGQKLKISSILVGEVWIYAGGSHASKINRQQPDAAAIAEEIKAAPEKNVCLFSVSMKTAPEPQQDVQGRWVNVDAGSASSLNSGAYYAGRRLTAELGVPVGIIVAAHWAGQPIETWMRRSALENNPVAKPILDYYASNEWKLKSEVSYEARLKAWMDFCQKLPLNPPPKPTPEDTVENLLQQAPSCIWNATVSPLTNLAVRGVIWDHGDNDTSLFRAVQYGQLLPGLIADWRIAFRNPDLPFVIVQLRAFFRAVPWGLDSRLAAEMRDGQRMAAVEAKAELVVNIDLDKDPHPRDVAPRIAGKILEKVYRKDGILTDGPELLKSEIAGDKVILHFGKTKGGLMAKGGTLKGFAIASSMFRWVWADAEIKGDSVIISAPTVDKPQGVRYAYQDFPQHGASLYNGAGCPAAPFRTDDHITVSGMVVKPSERLGYNRRSDIAIENPRLPRVLIIGDSISGHYIDSVCDGLRDRANVIGEASMGKDGTWASMGPKFYRSDWASRGDGLKDFLKERGPFDIVHFNNGIHNFSRAKPGDEVPYAEQLRKVVAIIRESGAICLFANSTGTIGDDKIPNSPNYLTNCKAFNAAAEAVMRELNVPVTDIYGALQPRIEELISSDLIHPKWEANPIMAKVIIGRIDEALAQLSAKRKTNK